MIRRDEQHRCTSTTRRWLAQGAIGALLIGAIGCGADTMPKAGGANTQKAKENRKVAEASVVEAVQYSAREQVAAHSELKPKNGFVKAGEKVIRFFGMDHPVQVSTNSPVSTNAPPAAPVPESPPAPVFTPPPAITVMTRPEQAPLRMASRHASPVVISERIVTEIPYPTEAEAEMHTLEDAQRVIAKRLRELDPPVDYVPPLPVIKNEYVRRDSRLVRLPSDSEKSEIARAGYASDRKYVDYTVEVTAEQIRELRTRNRVADGLRGLGIIAAVALAGFCFLRLDEWSKGYLTSWLALAAAGLGGGIVAAVLFV